MPAGRAGTLHCPVLIPFSPHATRDPSLLSATVCPNVPPGGGLRGAPNVGPAAILTYLRPGGSGGWKDDDASIPQSRTEPSLRRLTVRWPPARTWTSVTPAGAAGALHCAKSLFPHVTTWPSLSTAAA